jgi:hypothetical protein
MCVENYVLRNVILRNFTFVFRQLAKGGSSLVVVTRMKNNVTHVLTGIHQTPYSTITLANIFMFT